MDQHIFDCIVFTVAWERVEVGGLVESLSSYQDSVLAYREIYPEDYFVYPAQIKEAVDLIVTRYRHIGKKIFLECLQRILGERMDLDENMQKPSGLKKYLKGVVFTKSHPNPFARVRLCEQNCKHLINPYMNAMLLEEANIERAAKETMPARKVIVNPAAALQDRKIVVSPPPPQKPMDGEAICPKCKKTGAISNFQNSEAGSFYRRCPDCGTNFQS